MRERLRKAYSEGYEACYYDFGPVLASLRTQIETLEARVKSMEDWRTREEDAAEKYWEDYLRNEYGQNFEEER